ncbi:MAG: hypothetical protein QOH26_1789 [Actinomycetota bacterium]|nr:hypothetical protein [Actinomycetota bacterium]
MGLSALLVALLCAGCSGERFVETIVIDNPTAFNANVDVAAGESEAWMGLITAEANSETAVEQIYDQGSTWVFRFSYSGYEESIELSRAELARSGWRVTVPESFATALRERGVLPPP